VTIAGSQPASLCLSAQVSQRQESAHLGSQHKWAELSSVTAKLFFLKDDYCWFEGRCVTGKLSIYFAGEVDASHQVLPKRVPNTA